MLGMEMDPEVLNRIADAMEEIARALARVVRGKANKIRKVRTPVVRVRPTTRPLSGTGTDLEHEIEKLTEGVDDLSAVDLFDTLEMKNRGPVQTGKMLISRCLTRLGFIKYRLSRAQATDGGKRPERWRRMA